MKKILPILTILLLFLGCNKRPADVPPLFPCKITVTKNGTPIGNVHVILGAEESGVMCISSGITNSSGTAVIHTNRGTWQGDGVPQGEYIVAISKNPKYERGMSKEEYQKLDSAAQERYDAKQQREWEKLPREIPDSLAGFSTSPYRITVSEKGENQLTIDVKSKK